MGPRRDLRRDISSTTKLLLYSPASLTQKEREKLLARKDEMIERYRAEVKGEVLLVTDEDIDTREKVIAKSPELTEVFQVFWSIMLPFTVDGVLQKAAYLKLQSCFQYCLIGTTVTEETAMSSAEADWAQDAYLFGAMNQIAFQNMLFELLHMWVDHTDEPRSYAIFAWSMLKSIADLTNHPPVLRMRRAIPCIGNIPEVDMYKEYVRDKEMRQKIFVQTTQADFASESNIAALNRASQRTKVIDVRDEKEAEKMHMMIAVLERQAAKIRDSNDDGSGTDTDEDLDQTSLNDSVESEDIEWRRKQRERLAEEEARRRLLALEKKKRRKLNKTNARSYFLEVGRGQGADSAYDISDDTWGGNAAKNLMGSKALGGNWIGGVGEGKSWQKAALMEFLSSHLNRMAMGLTPEQLAAMSLSFDLAKLKLLWVKYLSAQENERKFLRVFTPDLQQHERLQGSFGIMGKSSKALSSLYKHRKDDEDKMRESLANASKYGAKALEQLRLISKKVQEQPHGDALLRNVILTSKGEMAIRLPTVQRSPTSPTSGISPNRAANPWMECFNADATTPSFASNQRTASTRPSARSKLPAPLIPLNCHKNKGGSLSLHGQGQGTSPPLRLSVKQPMLSMSMEGFDDSASEASIISAVTPPDGGTFSLSRSQSHSHSSLHAKSAASMASLPPQLQRRYLERAARRRLQLEEEDERRSKEWQATRAAETLGALSDRFGFEFDMDDELLNNLDLDVAGLSLAPENAHWADAGTEMLDVGVAGDEGRGATATASERTRTREERRSAVDTLSQSQPPLETAPSAHAPLPRTPELQAPHPSSPAPLGALASANKLLTQPSELGLGLGLLADPDNWDDSMVRALVSGTLQLQAQQQQQHLGKMGLEQQGLLKRSLPQTSQSPLPSCPTAGSVLEGEIEGEGGGGWDLDNDDGFGFSRGPGSCLHQVSIDSSLGASVAFAGSRSMHSTSQRTRGSSSTSTTALGTPKPLLLLPPLLVVLESLYVQAETTRYSLLNRPRWVGPKGKTREWNVKAGAKEASQ